MVNIKQSFLSNRSVNINMNKQQSKKQNNDYSKEDVVKMELDEYMNLYKTKKVKMEEFLQNLLFNLNYIQYKILELSYIINE